MTILPSPPPPANERALIEWLLRYGRDFELVRTVYPSNLDRVIQLFADEAEKELREHDSHRALRDRSDRIHELFAEGFFPALNSDIRNILSLEPTKQGHYMQIFVKMTLLDYLLLYKYKDNLQVAIGKDDGLALENLYQESTTYRENQGRVPFSPSIPDITKTMPIKGYSSGPYMLLLCIDVPPVGGGDFIKYKYVLTVVDRRSNNPGCFATLENSPLASNILCIFEPDGSRTNHGALAGSDLMNEFIVKSIKLLDERFNFGKLDEIAIRPKEKSWWQRWRT
jgi:hypothetical protein